MNTPKLEDLTKEELIALVHTCMFKVSEHQIRTVRFERLSEESDRLMQEGIKEQNRLKGGKVGTPENIKAWNAASDTFSRGDKMSEHACQIIEGNVWP